MDLYGRVAVVTGGANGIGLAMVERFLAEGASGVTVVDIEPGAVALASERFGDAVLGLVADVRVEAEIHRAVNATEERFGPVDLLLLENAGIVGGGGVFERDSAWQATWQVNVMAQVYAARAVVPRMLERGSGYLLNTASAAGLLTNIGNARYSVTKHAAVALAEWSAITYGDGGITVSCLCPQGVRTKMLGGADDPAGAVVLAQGTIEPDDVAAAVVRGLRDERFLILPHPQVAEYLRKKATDPDRWLAGMRRLQARTASSGYPSEP